MKSPIGADFTVHPDSSQISAGPMVRRQAGSAPEEKAVNSVNSEKDRGPDAFIETLYSTSELPTKKYGSK